MCMKCLIVLMVDSVIRTNNSLLWEEKVGKAQCLLFKEYFFYNEEDL